jgi:antitoxin YefM
MTTCSNPKAHDRLDFLWNRTISTGKPVILKRRGKESVALLPAAELGGLLTTVHLLRSPRNARRLLAALQRADAGCRS